MVRDFAFDEKDLKFPDKWKERNKMKTKFEKIPLTV